MQQIIANGITKLAGKDAKEALKHWELYEAQQLFGDDMTRETKLAILKQLVKQGFPKRPSSSLANPTPCGKLAWWRS